MKNDIEKYLDDKGRIKTWPAKLEKKKEVLEYLSTKFDYVKFYTEKEVNNIIDNWHTFNDYFLLRRGLVDYKLLLRTRNGARYWKEEFNSTNIVDQTKVLTIKTDRLTVRPTVSDDLSQLNRLFEQVKEYFDADPTYIAVSPEKCLEEGDLPPGGIKENYEIYSILENNSIIGYFDCYMGYPDPKVIYISLMYIDKNRRKCGYGKEVLKIVGEYYKSLDFNEIRLAVSLKNLAGLKFWYKCGFDKITAVAPTDDFNYDGYGCLELMKSLLTS